MKRICSNFDLQNKQIIDNCNLYRQYVRLAIMYARYPGLTRRASQILAFLFFFPFCSRCKFQAVQISDSYWQLILADLLEYEKPEKREKQTKLAPIDHNVIIRNLDAQEALILRQVIYRYKVLYYRCKDDFLQTLYCAICESKTQCEIKEVNSSGRVKIWQTGYKVDYPYIRHALYQLVRDLGYTSLKMDKIVNIADQAIADLRELPLHSELNLRAQATNIYGRLDQDFSTN